MENFNSKTKNTKIARIPSKVCAWILSIMLVVTGIAPGFAKNVKSNNDGTSLKEKTTNSIKPRTQSSNPQQLDLVDITFAPVKVAAGCHRQR